MRKQYYFRSSAQGLLAWDVDRLVRLSSAFLSKPVELSRIHELDQIWLQPDKCPSWRAMLDHIKLIRDADLAYPIILSATGEVMDGMHRVAKAALGGHATIQAVQFGVDPDPDYVSVDPDALPY